MPREIDDCSIRPNTKEPYKRPSNATTREQRASVQGKPCIDCGAVTEQQVANHTDPLVKQYYEGGGIDYETMRSTQAVTPHCPTCSASSGGSLSWYSREWKIFYGWD